MMTNAELDEQTIAHDEKANGKDDNTKQPKQADVLITLASAAELFHDRDGGCHADITVNGHRETWPIRSRGFKRWLLRRFFEHTNGAPNTDAMQAALGVIEAKAHYDSPEHLIYLRVGEYEDKVYLDLCNAEWQAIEVSSRGWEILDNPPVRFRRAEGMQALPAPSHDGSIDDLRPFLNVKTDEEFILAVTWILAGLRSRGPYPVLVPFGEHGSGKSSFCRILRSLIDPNKAPLRTLPRDERDLCISAQNGWVVVTDNVSRLPTWLSDAYCRLATGGGMATRQLYTDQDEIIFDAQRPIILNGIVEFVTRPDLADRAVFLTLEPISKDECRSDNDLAEDFKEAHPRILGALLDGVAHGLNWLPQASREDLPRMADFAVWARACETAFWQRGDFDKAYNKNRSEAIGSILEADEVAGALRSLMEQHDKWEGAASQLLTLLRDIVPEQTSKSAEWPKNARSLSSALRSSAKPLRMIGINIAFARDATIKRTRKISVTKLKEGSAERNAKIASRPSSASKDVISQGVSPDTSMDASAGYRTQASNSKSNPTMLKNNGFGRLDALDAKSATFSAEPPDPDAWSYQYDDYPELPPFLDRTGRQ
jgi:hypothetical protein